MKLRADFTFDRFVPSGPRAVAYGACRKLAPDPSGAGRLLFLHGPPGVGKTHLLSAIGLAAGQREAVVRSVAVTATELNDEIVAAIRHDTLIACRAAYARVQLLLVDDLQLLANHPATLTEVGRIVGECLNAGGVVACTAACPPARLGSFAARLRSDHGARFVALRRPSRTYMGRIVRQLASRIGVSLAGSAADRLARQSRGDVRRAIGAVAREELRRSLASADQAGKTGRTSGSARGAQA